MKSKKLSIQETFLKVNKGHFRSDLGPLEILIISQVEEYINNGLECFISNEELSWRFNVSMKTIARALDKLEQKRYIVRETTTTPNGRKRKIYLGDKNWK